MHLLFKSFPKHYAPALEGMEQSVMSMEADTAGATTTSTTMASTVTDGLSRFAATTASTVRSPASIAVRSKV